MSNLRYIRRLFNVDFLRISFTRADLDIENISSALLPQNEMNRGRRRENTEPYHLCAVDQFKIRCAARVKINPVSRRS
jgi:hypothetical protein